MDSIARRFDTSMALPLLILSCLSLVYNSGGYATHLFMTLGLGDLQKPQHSEIGSLLILWREDHISLKVDMSDPVRLSSCFALHLHPQWLKCRIVLVP